MNTKKRDSEKKRDEKAKVKFMNKGKSNQKDGTIDFMEGGNDKKGKRDFGKKGGKSFDGKGKGGKFEKNKF